MERQSITVESKDACQDSRELCQEKSFHIDELTAEEARAAKHKVKSHSLFFCLNPDLIGACNSVRKVLFQLGILVGQDDESLQRDVEVE